MFGMVNGCGGTSGDLPETVREENFEVALSRSLAYTSTNTKSQGIWGQ